MTETVEDATKRLESRMRGAFYGCLAGDALGAPVEFRERDSFPPVTDMIPCPNFGGLPAGSFTDDGSMMLCLAASLVHADGYDAYNALWHYGEWYKNGYMSVTEECFDIGYTTARALTDFLRKGRCEAKTTGEYEAGNGSVMRLAPIPMWYGADFDSAWFWGCGSSLATHANAVAVWGCGLWSVLVAAALYRGASTCTREEMVLNILGRVGAEKAVPDAWKDVVAGGFRTKTRDAISASGYVVHTVEAALWAFLGTDTFEEGALRVVNLGQDADTVGAVYGTLAGAWYGVDGIPDGWLDALQKPVMIAGVFMDLWAAIRARGAVKNT